MKLRRSPADAEQGLEDASWQARRVLDNKGQKAWVRNCLGEKVAPYRIQDRQDHVHEEIGSNERDDRAGGVVQGRRETNLVALLWEPIFKNLGNLLQHKKQDEEGAEAADLQSQAGVGRGYGASGVALPDKKLVNQVADRVLQHDGDHEDDPGKNQVDDPLGKADLVALVGLPGKIQNDENY